MLQKFANYRRAGNGWFSRPWIVFASFTIAYFFSQFYRSANAVIAPTLRDELALSAAELGLMTSLFFATFAITQFPLGVALDRWGARWVTTGLMMVAVVGSFVFAFGSSVIVLMLGRALLGIGLAGILMGGLKALSQWFPQERFGSLTGMLTAIGGLGALVATTPMAWLNAHVGWRAIFVGGALLLVCSLTFIILATDRRLHNTSHNRPQDTTQVAKANPRIGLPTIFSNLTFWRIALHVAWLTGFVIAFRGLWAGPYLFDVYNLSELEVGNLLLLMGIGGIAGSILAGWLADQIGIGKVVIIDSIILIVCQILLASLPPLFVVAAIYVTMGLAGGFPIALLAQARQIFPTHMTGQVMSMVNMSGFAGTFLLQWWIGEMLAFLPNFTGGMAMPQAYSVVLMITALVSVLTLMGYIPLTRPQQSAVVAPAAH